jgi:hypothetical protein
MSLKQQKLGRLSNRTISKDRLLEKMSEVISLREKVAQAELAAHLHRSSITDVKDPLSERLEIVAKPASSKVPALPT